MIRREDILFAYSMDRTLVSGGVTYLADDGPLGLHLSLAAATAPVRTVAADGISYLWNGTTSFLSMDATTAARFWSAITEGWTDWTVIFKAYFRAPAVSDAIFDSYGIGDAVANGGMRFQHDSVSAERFRFSYYNTAGGNNNIYESANIPLTGRTRVGVISNRLRLGLAATVYYRLYDGGLTMATGQNGTGVLAKSSVALPMIGRAIAGGSYFDGRLYYLALLRALPTPDEVTEISSLLMDGKVKPFCGGV